MQLSKHLVTLFALFSCFLSGISLSFVMSAVTGCGTLQVLASGDLMFNRSIVFSSL